MKKLRKNGGFTLIEMLIVVAIIAILIAISIPLINSALERARDATDQANERAAKAEAVLVYMGMGKLDDTAYSGGQFGVKPSAQTLSDNKPYYYDAGNGVIVADKPEAPYGKCTGSNCIDEYKKVNTYNGGNHVDMVLQVGVNANGEVLLQWVK